MLPRHTKLTFFLLFACCINLIGCNAFEGIDRSINRNDFNARLAEAKLVLAAAEYDTALDLYNRMADENGLNDEVLRGRAAAKAGLSGFNMFAVLDSLQNDVTTPDSRAVFFVAAKKIGNTALLHEAMQDMGKINSPDNSDKIFRSLMACLHLSLSLIEKYDTNLNGRLDTPDQISFTTNDSKTPSWSEIYMRATTSDSIYSLEKAFIELTQAFDGRGSNWTMVSPIQGVSKTGTYTPANRKTILAVNNFVEGLQNTNARFQVAETAFKDAVMLLDGG